MIYKKIWKNVKKSRTLLFIVLYTLSRNKLSKSSKILFRRPDFIHFVCVVGEFDEVGGVELYTQVLYNLLHMIGKDADRNGQFEMIEHLRKAFHIEPKEHLEIYTQVCINIVSSSTSQKLFLSRGLAKLFIAHHVTVLFKIITFLRYHLCLISNSFGQLFPLF